MKKRERLESGQGMAEYAYLYAFIVLLLVVLLFIFGEEVRSTYQFIVETVEAVF